MRDSVTVRVPASSANLGPGFDSLGLALNLYDRVTAVTRDDEWNIEISGEGCETVSRGQDHLIVKAMHAAFDLMGERPRGVRLTCDNAIPHARGLGSSAAAITAGIVIARALVDGQDRLNDLGVYQLASDLEGHADNVAAALFGGLTFAWSDGAAASVHRLDAEAEVTVFVPPISLATQRARALLPESVSHIDAAVNAGRSALLIAALMGSPELLLPATEDRLHQSQRSAAMPESHKLMRQLRVESVPAVISGAGPSVLAFGRGVAEFAPEGWAVHELGVDSTGATLE